MVLWACLAVAAELTLLVGRGAVIDCPEGITRVATSNPEAVDATVAGDSEVWIHAKALGQATLAIWSKKGARTTYDITVEFNLQPLRKLLEGTFPNEKMDVLGGRDSLVLVGRASSQAVADRALALATASVKGAVSNLQVAPPAPEKQVLLRVRFAELNRSASSELGAGLLSTGAARMVGAVSTGQFPSGTLTGVGGGASKPVTFGLSDILNIFAFRPELNLGLLIRDLQSRGLLEILAEPNLVATSGKEASFLAGGEFPVPIAQGGATAGAITVQFREFGIRLTFLPVVTAHGTIRLHVKPEVSTVDLANGIVLSGFRVPALSTRRIETDIELAEGQSFVIGGLLDERVTENLSRMPVLAAVPVLGALFRSRTRTKGRTELIVLVTPESAMPVTGPVPLPVQAGKPAFPRMPVPFLGKPTALPGNSRGSP
jgi:pilus assembly protein CpaC